MSNNRDLADLGKSAEAIDVDASAPADSLNIDSSGNVGIGTSSPTSYLPEGSNLVVSDSGHTGITLASGTTSEGGIFFADGTSGTDRYQGMIRYNHNSNYMEFRTSAGERMRIDSSGNLLVGKTSLSINSAGVGAAPSGLLQLARSSDFPLDVNRQTTDGSIVNFRKDGTTVGSIGYAGSYLYIAGEGAGLRLRASDIIPTNGAGVGTDNTEDLGDAIYRFDDVFATNGTIQTSDQNEKQQIASLTDAEMNVAKRLSALFKTFKWNSAVEEKGDNARTHSGIIAQDMQQAFTDEGLDAGNYAMFISDTWWEKEISVDAVEEETDEEGNVITEGQDAYTYMDTKEEATEGYTERTRLGVRYPELFAFISAYNDQRFSDLEARIEALENV